MLASFFGGLSIFASIGIFVAAAADLLTSEQQKKTFNNRVFYAWNKFDDWKKLPYIENAMSYRVLLKVGFFAQILASLTILISSFVENGLYSLINGEKRGFALLGWLISALFSVFVVIPSLLNWAVKASHTYTYLIRLTIFCFPVFLLAFFATFSAYLDGFCVMGACAPKHFTSDIQAFSTLFFFDQSIGLLAILVCNLAFILLMYCFIFFLWILTFLLERIAENAKGPIFALGAILGALGSLLKIFF